MLTAPESRSAFDLSKESAKTLERYGLRHFARFTLVASHGKMVFTDAGPAFLVVVMDRNVELSPVDIEIESEALREFLKAGAKALEEMDERYAREQAEDGQGSMAG